MERLSEDEFFYKFCDIYGFNKDGGFSKKDIEEGRECIEGMGIFRLKQLEQECYYLKQEIKKEAIKNWHKWTLWILKII